MIEKKRTAPSMKLERKTRSATPKGKTAAERREAIAAGDSKPKQAPPEVVKLKTTPKMYRLSDRAINLVALACNADTAQGVRASLSGKVEAAIIAAYGHLEEEQ